MFILSVRANLANLAEIWCNQKLNNSAITADEKCARNLLELLVILEALGGEAKEAEIVFGVLFFSFLYEMVLLLVVELHRLQLLLLGEAALLLVGDHFEREGGDDAQRDHFSNAQLGIRRLRKTLGLKVCGRLASPKRLRGQRAWAQLYLSFSL